MTSGPALKPLEGSTGHQGQKQRKLNVFKYIMVLACLMTGCFAQEGNPRQEPTPEPEGPKCEVMPEMQYACTYNQMGVAYSRACLVPGGYCHVPNASESETSPWCCF